MNKELIIILSVLAIIVVILAVLCFTGRKALVYKIMTKIEFLYHSEYGQRKKAEALILLKSYIMTRFEKYALIQKIILFFLSDTVVSKTIDQLTPKINEFVKPLAMATKQITTEAVVNKFVEKLDLKEPEAKESLLGLAETLKVEAKDKGFFVAEAGVNGNTKTEGVNYYGKAGLGFKF